MLILKLKRTFRIRHLLKCLRIFFFEQSFKTKSQANTLLIVRLDAIGDYVLFRNFLEVIRNSEKYKNHEITVLGNQLWKPIAETADYSFVNRWIWVDRNLFTQNQSYRKSIISEVAKQGFETAVLPNAARDFLNGDSIIKASNARYKIGSKSSRTIDPWLIGFLGNTNYNQLIDTSAILFEFDKNKKFIEEWLQCTVSFNAPYFTIAKQTAQTEISILPGAGEKLRQWSNEHFASLITLLYQQFPTYKINLLGATSDSEKIEEIIALIPEIPVNNFAGKLPLNNLIECMQQSALIIAHDSGPLHLAMALKRPVIGLMTGKHYQRFAPYSHATNPHHFHFPIATETLDKWMHKYGPTYFEDVFLDINQISHQQVFQTCKKLL